MSGADKGAEEPMTESSLVDEDERQSPVPVGPGGPAARVDGDDAAAQVNGGEVQVNGGDAAAVPAPALGGADASLLALVDRLTAMLERSELGELEVASGGTTIVLRAPSAIERLQVSIGAAAAEPAEAPAPAVAAIPAGATSTPPAAARPSVNAPLTGIYYGAPSPGALPYVAAGDHVSVGQIIGLIEAMKLFNEIKSDLAGRVVRVCVDNGALVKARQPLIEVEPA
jgi:acetyl-CoA carboxylase biotin carboxyl carrier protein